MSIHLSQEPHEVIRAIDRSLQEAPQPWVAAFDADGTLWDTDLGENFLTYQIRHKLLKNLPEDPWHHYHQLKITHSPQVAYLWLAQINQGHSLAQVQTWAQECLDQQQPLPLFASQQKIIAHLLAKNVQVYIVTASVKWAVEPAAKLYGLTPDNVIGIATKTPQGIISSEQDGPITYRQGKVEALLKKTQGHPAFFAAGNTEGDLPLLENATHLRLVMAATQPGHSNYNTEQKMLALAKERGWFIFSK